MALPMWADVLIGIAAFLVAAGTIYRYILPAIRGFGRGIVGAVRLYKGTQRFIHDWTGGGDPPPMPDRLDTIAVELRKTNGGSTLRDLARGAAEGVIRLIAYPGLLSTEVVDRASRKPSGRMRPQCASILRTTAPENLSSHECLRIAGPCQVETYDPEAQNRRAT